MARVRQLPLLAFLDTARTQLYHFTTVVIAGMGIFTDAYDLFSISLVINLLGRIYYPVPGSGHHGKLSPGSSAAVIGTALFGAVAGQLFFGWLGDKMGRKRMYGVTLKLMVVCSLASGLSFRSTPKSVIATLCFLRFWLGFGVGGDYPLSATIMAEYANKKTRGFLMAAVFAMQGFGNLTAGVVTIIVSKAFKHALEKRRGKKFLSFLLPFFVGFGNLTAGMVTIIVSAVFKHAPAYQNDPLGQADYVWRIILMFGALPAILTYYWRSKMPETARYTALVAKNAKKAAADMAKVLYIEIPVKRQEIEALARREQFGLFSKEFVRRHGLHLLGTSICWFMLDVVFYAQNLFEMDIFAAVKLFPVATTLSPLEETLTTASVQTIVAVCGTLPGYWFTVAFIEIIGRKRIQIGGFAMMTAFLLGLAIPFHHWSVSKANQRSFAAMYALTFFFANFGPNSTTFVVPAEIFPTRLRSTCHGISGAVGKAGAIIVSFLFLYVPHGTEKTREMRNLLLVLASCSLVGLLFTFVLPEPKGKSLEELADENEED